MSARKPYMRPMEGWWRRNPYYVKYMLMELTSVIVAVYGVLLLVGVWRLSQGEAQYAAWQAAFASPLAIGLHVLLLLAMIYHAYTWWKVLPKTMPLIHVNARPVPGIVLSSGGWLATIAVSIIVFALAGWGT